MRAGRVSHLSPAESEDHCASGPVAGCMRSASSFSPLILGNLWQGRILVHSALSHFCLLFWLGTVILISA